MLCQRGLALNVAPTAHRGDPRGTRLPKGLSSSSPAITPPSHQPKTPWSALNTLCAFATWLFFSPLQLFGHPFTPLSRDLSSFASQMKGTLNQLRQGEDGLPLWLSGKESACQCRRCKRHRFDSWLGRSPGKGNGNPLQYSCLGNSIGRGAWPATVHGVAESHTSPPPFLPHHFSLDVFLSHKGLVGLRVNPAWLLWW